MPLSIAYKELFPVVLAAALWGPRWSSRRVEFCSDNMAVVEVLRSGTSRDPTLMALLRRLSLTGRPALFFIYSYSYSRKTEPCGWCSFPFQFSGVPSFGATCSFSSNPDPCGSSGGASGPVTQKCLFYLSNGLAPSTQRVYSSAQKQFIEFCLQDGCTNQDGSILPASEQALMRFCSHLADRLYHTSIKVYLSGVRSLHIDTGFSDPLVNCLQLQRVLRGIKRHQGSRKSPRQPITGDLMRVIHSVLSLSDYSQAMLWAACCLGFFGFLRAGEFTVNEPFDPAIHPTPQDLQLDSTSNPTCLRVHLKASKTDPFRQGCFIYLGRGRTSICPIASVMAYLHHRGPAPGPLFLQENGQPLTRTQLSNFLQSTLSAVGITGTYSGHSFRIGAATTAAQLGLPDHLIKTMGRWSSDAYQLYVRTPVQSILNVSGQLL